MDSTGAVNVLYFDDRNTSSDSSEIMLSRSKDGGNTWNEFIISTHRFKPKPITGAVANYQGDFITIISGGNKLFTYWMDDYSGIYQCWSSVIDLSTIGIRKIETEIPNSFLLSQNYPNPFNPVTKINFTVPKDGLASLKIYDIRGVEIASPVNEELNTGKYEITFDASNLASGTYFYKLDFTSSDGNKFSSTKKLVVLK